MTLCTIIFVKISSHLQSLVVHWSNITSEIVFLTQVAINLSDQGHMSQYSITEF